MTILNTAAAAASNAFYPVDQELTTSLAAPDYIDQGGSQSDDFDAFGGDEVEFGPSSVDLVNTGISPLPAVPAVPAPSASLLPAASAPVMTMPGRAGRKVQMVDVYLSLKNAIRLKWNQGENVGLSGANFLTKSKPSSSLGDFLVVELMSWYPHYIVSPKQSGAPKELVKYSADGIRTNDGILVTDWVQNLKRQKFVDAKCEERLMLVGTLLDCGKASKDPKVQKLVGTPIMVDLTPTSVSNWDKFRIATGIALRDKKFDPELVDMSVLLLTAEAVSGVTKTGNAVNYGKCEMALYDPTKKAALEF